MSLFRAAPLVTFRERESWDEGTFGAVAPWTCEGCGGVWDEDDICFHRLWGAYHREYRCRSSWSDVIETKPHTLRFTVIRRYRTTRRHAA
jgi:hypothetical protein